MANLPTTMHGVQLTAHGDFDTLKYATDIHFFSLLLTHRSQISTDIIRVHRCCFTMTHYQDCFHKKSTN